MDESDKERADDTDGEGKTKETEFFFITHTNQRLTKAKFHEMMMHLKDRLVKGVMDVPVLDVANHVGCNSLGNCNFVYAQYIASLLGFVDFYKHVTCSLTNKGRSGNANFKFSDLEDVDFKRTEFRNK